MSTEPRGTDGQIRDHLANERTFLAWVRTSVTFIGLGFAVDRLLPTDASGQVLGLLLVMIGGGMMLPAVTGFRRTARAIAAGGYAPPVLTSTVIAAIVVAGALALAMLILLRSS
jgi:putative membrane protein